MIVWVSNRQPPHLWAFRRASRPLHLWQHLGWRGLVHPPCAWDSQRHRSGAAGYPGAVLRWPGGCFAERYGDQICFIGNIDVSGCLSFGTVDDVVRETKEHIDRLAYNGGYVVASSHSITPVVKPENYVAMLETVIDYGVY